MTTEHMHHEHGDVDTSVVEYPSALDTTINPTTNETATSHKPIEAHGEVDIPSPEPIAPVPTFEEDQEVTGSQEVSFELLPATATPSETVCTGVPFSDNQDEPAGSPIVGAEESTSGIAREEQQTQETIDLPEEPSSPDIQEESTSGAILAKVDLELINLQEKLTQTSSQEQVSQPLSDIEAIPDITALQLEAVPANLVSPLVSPEIERKPLLGTKVEEIRPFTDFIEEFRAAEAARLQAALHESQVEAFTLLSPVESVFSASASTTDTVDSIKESGNAVAQFEQSTPITSGPTATDETSASSSEGDENGLVSPTGSGDHSVSPLLRPATRLRVSRHGTGRHHREEQASQAETPAPVQQEEAQIAPSEPPVVTPPPKPTRRYRFDRPSSTKTVSPSGMNGTAQAPTSKFTTGQTLSEETRSGVTPIVDLAIIGEQAVSETTQSIGLPVHKLTATKETASAESIGAIIASPSEQGRRRHAQKDQPIAASPATQAEAAPITELASAIEPSVLSEEVAPEDLPPLEYSDLQKAHPRRRRRHRSGSNSNTPASPVVSDIPVVPSAAPTFQPSPDLVSQIPSAPVPPSSVSASSYSIVSGYTVSQMNQGNDVAGPFFGPEPSPARGSGFSRDGRAATRPGPQRTPVSPTAPTSRAGDNGLTSASINQFATIVSQAIETQTDRMVAEFRRLGQAPTNVSVSLPPFPSSERVGVFVDVANLLYSARTLRVAVDFGKLLDFLRGNRRLIRAHAYCPTSPQPGDEQMFLQAVKGLGYRITTKNYKTFSSGAKKADLDLDLCMDVVRLVDGRAVDCVVLLSGDSDFMPMLDYCSDHGVRVEVAAFDEAMSATLRQSCDLFINLSMLEEIRA